MDTQSSIKIYSGIKLQRIKIDDVVSNNTIAQSRNNVGKNKSNFVIETEFDNKEISANYFELESLGEVTAMTFYKKTPSQKYYNLVTDDEVATFIMDYNIRNYEYYHYMVAITRYNRSKKRDQVTIYENKVDDDGKDVQYEGHIQYLKTFWDSWSICNIEQSPTSENTYIKVGDIWRLKYNISEESLNQNLNITVWDTLSRYSKISRGQKDFISSTFTGLLGDIKQYKNYKNEENIIRDIYDKNYSYPSICGYTERMNEKINPYATEMDKLRAWLEFCSDGKLKLLKDQKGNSWVVQIIRNPNNNIDIKSNLQETLISFEWQEVMDVSKISVVRVAAPTYNENYIYSD